MITSSTALIIRLGSFFKLHRRHSDQETEGQSCQCFVIRRCSQTVCLLCAFDFFLEGSSYILPRPSGLPWLSDWRLSPGLREAGSSESQSKMNLLCETGPWCPWVWLFDPWHSVLCLCCQKAHSVLAQTLHNPALEKLLIAQLSAASARHH